MTTPIRNIGSSEEDVNKGAFELSEKNKEGMADTLVGERIGSKASKASLDFVIAESRWTSFETRINRVRIESVDIFQNLYPA